MNSCTYTPTVQLVYMIIILTLNFELNIFINFFYELSS